MTRPVPRYPLPAAATLSDACEAAALQLLSDILLMHAAVTIPLGEMPQLISPQLLDSAAHRPFYLFGDDFMYQTGLDQAAALFQSLVQNHAFEDGNKRTALTACLFFLERCGYWRGVGLLTAKEAEELEALTLLIANEKTLWSGGTSIRTLQVGDIAQAIDNILGPSRNRRARPARLLRGILHRIGGLLMAADGPTE